MSKAKQPAQDKMLRPQADKASDVSTAVQFTASLNALDRVRVRLLEIPPALRVLVVPSDKVIECDPALADILIAEGYAEMADDSTVK